MEPLKLKLLGSIQQINTTAFTIELLLNFFHQKGFFGFSGFETFFLLNDLNSRFWKCDYIFTTQDRQISLKTQMQGQF